jgi:hypothetical protein
MYFTPSTLHLLPILQQQCCPIATMPPSVLGIGIPASSPLVPWVARSFLQKSLNTMEADMKSSVYEWEMLYLTPEGDFDVCIGKLRERRWDVVMVGSKFLIFSFLWFREREYGMWLMVVK